MLCWGPWGLRKPNPRAPCLQSQDKQLLITPLGFFRISLHISPGPLRSHFCKSCHCAPRVGGGAGSFLFPLYTVSLGNPSPEPKTHVCLFTWPCKLQLLKKEHLFVPQMLLPSTPTPSLLSNVSLHAHPSPLHFLQRIYHSMELSLYLVCVSSCSWCLPLWERNKVTSAHVLSRAPSSVVSKLVPFTWEPLRNAHSQTHQLSTSGPMLHNSELNKRIMCSRCSVQISFFHN